jgi:hypothetical protein
MLVLLYKYSRSERHSSLYVVCCLTQQLFSACMHNASEGGAAKPSSYSIFIPLLLIVLHTLKLLQMISPHLINTKGTSI